MTREEAISQLISLSKEDVGVYSDAVEYGIKVLEQEPCEDCISRQALIEKATSWKTHFTDSERCVSLTDIQNAPPVTPAEKVGHWEWNQYDSNPKIGNFHCSQCHGIGKSYYDYCPSCGRKMQEVKNV